MGREGSLLKRNEMPQDPMARFGVCLRYPDALMHDEPIEGRLDSWKEIAAYLGRGIRTVQRWER